jgi:parallel beta-helix repeat protein
VSGANSLRPFKEGQTLYTNSFSAPPGFVGLNDVFATKIAAQGGDASATVTLATGANLQRTLAAYFADSVNALNFTGVDPTGATDSTAGIMAAHASAAASGKALRLPEGTYLHSGLNNITQPIIGAGRAKTKLQLASNAPTTVNCITVVPGSTGWYAVGITLDGANPTPTETGTVGASGISIASNGSGAVNVDCYVHDCAVQNMALNGVFAGSCINLSIHNVKVLNCVFHGIHADGSGARVTNCWVSTTGADNINIDNTPVPGVTFPTQDTIVANNHCDTAGVNAASRADNITGYNSLNTNFIVANNICDTSQNHNIHVGGNNIAVHGNTCIGATITGILFEPRLASTGAEPVPCSFMSCIGNQVYNGGQDAIEVQEYTGVVCNDNLCNGNTLQGINIISSADVTVCGNTLTNNLQEGIRLNAITNGAVTGNTVVGNNQGIALGDTGVSGTQASTGVVISGNSVVNNGTHGILSGGTDTVNLITGNISTGHTTADIGVTAGDIARNNFTTGIVDFLTWSDATVGGVITIGTAGADADIPLLLSTKGPTSFVSMRPDSLEVMRFNAATGTVNKFNVVSAATGNAPTIQATGTDTNVSLKLQPQGTGAVEATTFFQNTSTSAVAAAGSTLATATALTTWNNHISTATAGQGVSLPVGCPIGSDVWVANRSGVAVIVYPDTASTEIEGGGVGVAVSVASGSTAHFLRVTGNWIQAQ